MNLENMIDSVTSTVITTEVAIVIFLVGSVQETFKQIYTAWRGPEMKSNKWFKTFMAAWPLITGPAFGIFVIPEGGFADPWVMGGIAGVLSSKVYDLIAPAAKAYLVKRVKEVIDED